MSNESAVGFYIYGLFIMFFLSSIYSAVGANVTTSYELYCENKGDNRMALIKTEKYRASFDSQIVLIKDGAGIAPKNCSVFDSGNWICRDPFNIRMKGGLLEEACANFGSTCRVGIPLWKFWLSYLTGPNYFCPDPAAKQS